MFQKQIPFSTVFTNLLLYPFELFEMLEASDHIAVKNSTIARPAANLVHKPQKQSNDDTKYLIRKRFNQYN